jgi:hypothetical protein
MKFNSKAGQEVRTWILFFTGVALAVIFAIKDAPLNPWWTLIIGAFTCTAVIVSAVQAVAGDISQAARKAVEDAKTNSTQSEDEAGPTLSFAVGPPIRDLVWTFRGGNTASI